MVRYYENSGEEIPHYIGVLNDLRDGRSYTCGTHTAPHDIVKSEFGKGTRSGGDLLEVFPDRVLHGHGRERPALECSVA